MSIRLRVVPLMRQVVDAAAVRLQVQLQLQNDCRMSTSAALSMTEVHLHSVCMVYAQQY